MPRKMTLTKKPPSHQQQSQGDSPAKFGEQQQQVHQEEVEALDSNSFEDFGAASSSHTPFLNE